MKVHNCINFVSLYSGRASNILKISRKYIGTVTPAWDSIVNYQSQYCLKGMIPARYFKIGSNILPWRSIGLATSFLNSLWKGLTIGTIMTKEIVFSHVNDMIISRQSEPFVQNKRIHRLVASQIFIGFFPSFFPFVCAVIAMRFQRKLRLVDKAIQLIFNIFGKGRRIRPGRIGVLKDVLRRDCWHRIVIKDK